MDREVEAVGEAVLSRTDSGGLRFLKFGNTFLQRAGERGGTVNQHLCHPHQSSAQLLPPYVFVFYLEPYFVRSGSIH